MAKQTALLVGATGLVGHELLDQLLNRKYYDQVKVLVRKPMDLHHPKLEVIELKDFDQMDSIKDQLLAQDYFCCLGTTIKKAGSKEAFKKVDLDYPLKLARIARDAPDFRDFLVVTAAGGNADSPLFYNQVKGELEDQLNALGVPRLKIFRPSLLLGKREEFRLGEEFAKMVAAFFSFFMVGTKRNLWSIHASDVAKAMFIIATEAKPGSRVYSSSDMYKLAKTQGL